MTPATWLRIGAIAGAIGVALGAFGAHGLKDKLSEYALGVYITGVTYQMYHAPALLAVGLLDIVGRGGTAVNVAGWAFTAGIVIFSGSLYLLAFTGARWLGAITPIGGLAFIVGWVALAIAAGSAGRGIAVEV